MRRMFSEAMLQNMIKNLIKKQSYDVDNIIDITPYVDDSGDNPVISEDGLNLIEDKSCIVYNGYIYTRIYTDSLYFVNISDDMYLNILSINEIGEILLADYQIPNTNMFGKINDILIIDGEDFELLPVITATATTTCEDIHNSLLHEIGVVHNQAQHGGDFLASFFQTGNVYQVALISIVDPEVIYKISNVSKDTLFDSLIINANKVKKLRLYNHFISFKDSSNQEHTIYLTSNVGDNILDISTEFMSGDTMLSGVDDVYKAITYFFYDSGSIDVTYGDGTSDTFTSVTDVTDIVAEIF